MSIIRAQVQVVINPLEPKDSMVITPHFNFQLGLGDYDNFAHDLALQIQAWQASTSPARKIRVKLYDVEGPKPHYPKADFETPTGNTAELAWPRELALCLSFYSEHNRKRNRGRLYVCPGWMFTGSGIDLRPTTAIIDKVMALGVLLKDTGGADVDWCVWSRVDQEARPVTDYWVDDEWDIQRRRGQKSSMRKTGVTSEA